MDVNACLFAGEEEQSKLAVADDGGSHVITVDDGSMATRGFGRVVAVQPTPAGADFVG